MVRAAAGSWPRDRRLFQWLVVSSGIAACSLFVGSGALTLFVALNSSSGVSPLGVNSYGVLRRRPLLAPHPRGHSFQAQDVWGALVERSKKRVVCLAQDEQELADMAKFGCDDSGCMVDDDDDDDEEVEDAGSSAAIPWETFGNFLDQWLPEEVTAQPTQRRGELLEDPSAEFASLEPSEVRRYLTRPSAFTYEIMQVTSEGKIRTLTMAREALLRETNLKPRDLRAVAVQPVPGFDAGPVLASRSGTLLLGVGGVRALIQEDRAFLFVFGKSSRDRSRFLRVLENQRRAAVELELEAGGGLSGLSGAGGGSFFKVPFRMLVVESALLALSRRLDSRLLQIRNVTAPKLRAPPILREADLEEVRQLRRSLVRCASQASAVYSALLSRLDSEEAASSAQAGGLPGLRQSFAQGLAQGFRQTLQASGDSMARNEWEAVFEVYLQAFSEISRECASLLQDIEDFEGSASLALQARRLRVEQFELSLVITSVSIGAGGLVPAAMGMNLLTGFETSEAAFKFTLLTTLSVILLLYFSIRLAASKQGFLL
ncbi:unnamed protein product [Polarella glacialis]|uniref:Magnesium transporter n=1 Tax=Polarella glacialis TaxID=89957 RepID=A0A813FYC7_POLGL|nr:unnamed protein product [Polarella glacialis]CAE8691219.1 unnamed protein product [Polarella glacialis]